MFLFSHRDPFLAVVYRQASGAVREPQNQDPHSRRILGVEVLRSQRTGIGNINIMPFPRQSQGTGGPGAGSLEGAEFS